jgi:hypothetical protein
MTKDEGFKALSLAYHLIKRTVLHKGKIPNA